MNFGKMAFGSILATQHPRAAEEKKDPGQIGGLLPQGARGGQQPGQWRAEDKRDSSTLSEMVGRLGEAKGVLLVCTIQPMRWAFSKLDFGAPPSKQHLNTHKCHSIQCEGGANRAGIFSNSKEEANGSPAKQSTPFFVSLFLLK